MNSYSEGVAHFLNVSRVPFVLLSFNHVKILGPLIEPSMCRVFVSS